jgi:hypothetical protein
MRARARGRCEELVVEVSGEPGNRMLALETAQQHRRRRHVSDTRRPLDLEQIEIHA